MDWLTNNIVNPVKNWFNKDPIGQAVGGIGDFLQQVGQGATSIAKHIPGVGEIVQAAQPLLNTVSSGWDAIRNRGNGPSMQDVQNAGSAIQATQNAYTTNKGQAKTSLQKLKNPMALARSVGITPKRMRVM